jgi:hypothetical protein
MLVVFAQAICLEIIDFHLAQTPVFRRDGRPGNNHSIISSALAPRSSARSSV